MSHHVRCSGILCHVTSLSGRWGIGDFGNEAYRFVDWLVEAGQSLWQVLPLGPPGYGESPYQCFSAFAGNPLMIGLDRLVEAGWLSPEELETAPAFSQSSVDFEQVRQWREAKLIAAHTGFQQNASSTQQAEFADFRNQHAWWLEDYALFAALKHAHAGRPWPEWEQELVTRQPQALHQATTSLALEVEQEVFRQFQFDRQWRELKEYANARGIRIMGDVPIFVAHDSADVWAHQHLFSLNEQGQPTVIAGVPPDYFSVTGQRWGNPLYRWDVMRDEGYGWWISRLRHVLTQVDLLRLDHFRGFAGYWEIPGESPTAAGGRWLPGPGEAFFRKVLDELGELPLVAEDLGLITPDVEALRDTFKFPGMRILQFAFGEDPKGSDYQPHNYPHNSVVYTGTHDNDTTVGWFNSQAGKGTTRTAEQISEERARVLHYLGTDGSEIHWDMIRMALASVADTAILPLQDVLGLGSEARMNLPGSASDNWRWRYLPGSLTSARAQRMAELTALYERLPLNRTQHSPGATQHAP